MKLLNKDSSCKSQREDLRGCGKQSVFYKQVRTAAGRKAANVKCEIRTIGWSELSGLERGMMELPRDWFVRSDYISSCLSVPLGPYVTVSQSCKLSTGTGYDLSGLAVMYSVMVTVPTVPWITESHWVDRWGEDRFWR